MLHVALITLESERPQKFLMEIALDIKVYVNDHHIGCSPRLKTVLESFVGVEPQMHRLPQIRAQLDSKLGSIAEP